MEGQHPLQTHLPDRSRGATPVEKQRGIDVRQAYTTGEKEAAAEEGEGGGGVDDRRSQLRMVPSFPNVTQRVKH